MSKPPVSILVPTFARTALLCEVIECFRRFAYQGPMELVILNDCDRQTLVCDVPGVRVVNYGKPFDTFGAKVNTLYGYAAHEHLIRVDDDDLLLPAAVSALMTKLGTYDTLAGKPSPMARFRKMLQWTGDLSHAGASMRVRSCSVHHGAVIRREAWRASGGLPLLAAGYPDVAFWERMTPQWIVGRWHHELDGHLLAIHRADPDRPHMEGADRASGHPPLSQSQWQRLMLGRIDAGLEPSGVVHLIPSWSRDWQAEADAVQKVAHE